MTVDPFDTAGLRGAVLRAWSDSPARFREDANAEESLVLGGYADRALTELLANGVDAAAAAGEPARLLVRLLDGEDGPILAVANTGRPLTAEGVASLASLRTSTKRRGGSVGHFGVGFTAVLGLTDRPEIHSADGAVRFSRADTTALLTEPTDRNPALAAEIRARKGSVPTLRLPFATEPIAPPIGYATEVRLPLDRPDVARKQWDDWGPDLLWALPGLQELVLDLGNDDRRWWRREDGPDGTTVVAAHDGTTRWLVVRAAGQVPGELVADRPVEEHDRRDWWITWVRPLPEDPEDTDPAAALARVLDGTPARAPATVGAPLPTDEPVTLPARVFGTFPVDDTRRRLADGPLTDHLLGLAARLYLDLVAAAPAAERWDLVPGADFPAGPVDAALTAQVLDLLGRRPLWASAAGDTVPGSSVRWVDDLPDPAAALLGQAVPGLVPTPVTGAGRAALGRIGGRRLDLSDAVAELAVLDRSPAFWHQVYAALANRSADDLAGVPVPLAGGGRRIGPRSVLVPGDDLPSDLLLRIGDAVPDLPLVHPDATHPALQRWGGRPADAGALLRSPELRELVRDRRSALDDEDPDPEELRSFAATVLDLVALDHEAGFVPDLVLTDEDDIPWPAEELLQPGAPLRQVLLPEEAEERPTVHPRWTDRPAEVLERVGVRSGFGLVRLDPGDPAAADLLPDLDEWVAEVNPPADEPVVGLADLDLVDDDAWADALDLIVGDPRTRAALLHRSGNGPGYAGWWIARHARPGGRPFGAWRRPSATALAAACDPFPPDAGTTSDETVADVLGLAADWADLAAAAPRELVRAWSDPDRTVPADAVPDFTAAVLDVLERHPDLPLPDRLRAVDGSLVPAEQAVVVDIPWAVDLVAHQQLVVGGVDPVRAADLLEVDLLSDRCGPAEVDQTVAADPDRGALRRALVAAGAAEEPDVVVGRVLVRPPGSSSTVAVPWWPVDGRWWTDGSAEALGAVVAWTSGVWPDRYRVIAAAAGHWPDPTVGLTGPR